MTKEVLLFGLIELIVLLIPVATVFIKYGSWKKEIEIKINSLEISDTRQDSQYSTILSTMNDIQMSIVRLETKFQFFEREGTK